MTSMEKLLEKVIELNKNRKFEKVISILSSNVLERFNDDKLYAEKAKSLSEVSRFNELKQVLKLGLQINPKNINLLYYLGYSHFIKKDYDKAKFILNKALQIDRNSAILYNGLGNVYKRLKDFEIAKEYYKKAIQIAPKFSKSYNGLGNVYFELEEFDKAIQFYEAAIKMEPKSSSPYIGLGNVYKELERYSESIEYYLKSISINSTNTGAFYNIGNVYFKLEEFEKSKVYYEKFILVWFEKNDFYVKSAIEKVKEIEKIIANNTYKKVNDIVQDVKELLKYKEDCVTHYTGISTVQFLILNESTFRLSEGSFLNDTSEGQEVFSFLDYKLDSSSKSNREFFTKRPFIGSFVDAEKNNDLTLWRMYGKEALEEAKGCSITLNAKELIQEVKNKIIQKSDLANSNIDDIEFYRVAYRNGNEFDFAGATTKQKKELSDLMQKLFEGTKEFKNKKKKKPNEEVQVIELLNQIAYLFKSAEYQYENEIRLIIKETIGFDRKIDFDSKDFKPSIKPFKVYIELVPISTLLKTITIGPKVDKAEEWASTFYYSLANKELYPEIVISTLPFK